MSETDKDVAGWLLVAFIPGMEPDTRQIVETWASSIADQNAAVDAVKHASGTAAVVVLMPLVEESLLGMNIIEPNQTARISAQL